MDSVITNVDMERIRVFFRISEEEEPGDDEGDLNEDGSDAGGEEAGQ